MLPKLDDRLSIQTTTEIVMSIGRNALLAVLAFGVIFISGCASLRGHEPIEVNMVGVEPLEGEGMELRMLVKLRIQNPNDTPLDFNGVSVDMDVQGARFATGVSDATGTVPRFGETVVAVPMSVSLFSAARQVMGAVTNEYRGKLAYEISGRLAGPSFNSVRFKSSGEFAFPTEVIQQHE
jgi:LEA14-like dessication related protein